MKNKSKIIFSIIIVQAILLSIFTVLFIKEARQNRTWPFNSGIQLPSFVKYYGYKFTNPESVTINTHLYEMKTEFLSIPDQEAIGGGGSVNILNKDNLLVTLDNGNNWVLNLSTKDFVKGPDIFSNKFLSIRDVNISPEKKEIAVLGGKYNNNCMVLKLKIYDFSFLENKLEIDNERTFWKSEQMCDEDFEPFIRNGGGRVIFYKNSYFISTGYLANSGIKSGVYYSFSQNPNSSFGKIIRIYDENNSEIYSIGHRNPQGLFVRKKNDLLISTEHGPRGGDEINLITENSNYGWPCKSIGTLYNYDNDFKNDPKLWPDDLQNSGCEGSMLFIDPLYSWTPSIGASQGLEYRGDEFSKMKNNLIVSSLRAESIFRLNLSDKNASIACVSSTLIM